MRTRWAVLLLLALSVLAGCSARNAATASEASAANGFLTIGGTTTKMGTIHYIREVTVRADGQVDEVRIIEATELFARLLSNTVETLAENAPEYHYAQSERDGVLRVRGAYTHDSLESFNEEGFAEVHLVDWPLYRTLRFDSAVGPVDDETLGQMFPILADAGNQEWLAFLHEAVRFSILMTDEETGKSYRWSRSAGQLGQNAPVSFTSKQWRSPSGYVALGAGLLLLPVLYLGLFGRRHWEPSA